MLRGQVLRSLIATVREEGLGPTALLEVDIGGKVIVAVDTVNAHVGHQVLVLTGCAAQRMSAAGGRFGDALIVAILDNSDELDK